MFLIETFELPSVPKCFSFNMTSLGVTIAFDGMWRN